MSHIFVSIFICTGPTHIQTECTHVLVWREGKRDFLTVQTRSLGAVIIISLSALGSQSQSSVPCQLMPLWSTWSALFISSLHLLIVYLPTFTPKPALCPSLPPSHPPSIPTWGWDSNSSVSKMFACHASKGTQVQIPRTDVKCRAWPLTQCCEAGRGGWAGRRQMGPEALVSSQHSQSSELQFREPVFRKKVRSNGARHLLLTSVNAPAHKHTCIEAHAHTHIFN